VISACSLRTNLPAVTYTVTDDPITQADSSAASSSAVPSTTPPSRLAFCLFTFVKATAQRLGADSELRQSLGLLHGF
jgi:hypothetical protein